MLVAAVAGLVWLRREGTWRERLLICWIVVPVLFFTLWPVKGFQYLLPIAPVLAVLAGRTLTRPLPLPRHWRAGRLAMGVLAAATAVSLVVPAWARSQPSARVTLAGTGGLPGGREAGEWILRHVPQGSQLLAIGPSMANVLEFYGHHQVSALSVSPNPHDRNPSYMPVPNPDLALRQGEFQYIVWDAYTASHSRSSPEGAPPGQAVPRRGRLHLGQHRAGPAHTVRPAIIIYEVQP